MSMARARRWVAVAVCAALVLLAAHVLVAQAKADFIGQSPASAEQTAPRD